MTIEPTILYECADWLVVNKPANWHTVRHGKRANSIGIASSPLPHSNLEGWIADQLADAAALPESGILHRLDYATTGCVIVARSRMAWERLLPIVRSGAGLSKIYAAVVKQGIEARGEFELYFSSRYRRSTKVSVSREGKAEHGGVCRWRLWPQLLADVKDVLVEVELVGPGRRHQIRAGLAFLGSPLRGDTLYGGSADWRGGMGLHAHQIELEGQTVVAPFPDGWGIAADKSDDQAIGSG